MQAGHYRHRSARILPVNKIGVAIARELSGFLWHIARQVKPMMGILGRAMWASA